MEMGSAFVFYVQHELFKTKKCQKNVFDGTVHNVKVNVCK